MHVKSLIDPEQLSIDIGNAPTDDTIILKTRVGVKEPDTGLLFKGYLF